VTNLFKVRELGVQISPAQSISTQAISRQISSQAGSQPGPEQPANQPASEPKFVELCFQKSIQSLTNLSNFVLKIQQTLKSLMSVVSKIP
jgi:hypothetical protein